MVAPVEADTQVRHTAALAGVDSLPRHTVGADTQVPHSQAAGRTVADFLVVGLVVAQMAVHSSVVDTTYYPLRA